MIDGPGPGGFPRKGGSYLALGVWLVKFQKFQKFLKFLKFLASGLSFRPSFLNNKPTASSCRTGCPTSGFPKAESKRSSVMGELRLPGLAVDSSNVLVIE